MTRTEVKAIPTIQPTTDVGEVTLLGLLTLGLELITVLAISVEVGEEEEKKTVDSSD